MKKGCDLPVFYGFSYETCNQACADLGLSINEETTNDNVIDEDYQADNPYTYAGVEPYDESKESTFERDCHDLSDTCQRDVGHCNRVGDSPKVRAWMETMCRKTCGLCPNSRNALKNRYAAYDTNGLISRSWSCNMVMSQEYSTHDAAKAACLNDWQCSYVLDQGCDGIGPFKLCTATSMIERSSQDCLYNKQG